jgi:hypothetical protein
MIDRFMWSGGGTLVMLNKSHYTYKMRNVLLNSIAASLLLASSQLFAKGENEIGSFLSYYDRAETVGGDDVNTTHLGLDVLYIRSLKSFWLGGELSYASSRSSISSAGLFKVGVPLKYWIAGPESKGLGFYVMATPYFGREDDSDDAHSLLGVKMAPGLVIFLSDMVGIDTKIYYDYTREGSSPVVTTGLMSGFSIYF